MVYLDLGMSSMQVDSWPRGFSYAYDAPLDMRMDPDQALTAADIVNTWDERRLARILREYGEERYASSDSAVDRSRPPPPSALSSTHDLVAVIKVFGAGPLAVRQRPSGPTDLPGAAHRGQ